MTAGLETFARAHGAALNVVQCSDSTMDLAEIMEERYAIPSILVSYLGIDEDMAQSLYDVADHFGDPEMLEKTRKLVKEKLARVVPHCARSMTSSGAGQTTSQ